MIGHLVILLLLTLAMGLQMLGFTGTCTQGSDGTFISGSVLSGPILVTAVGLAIWTIVRLIRSSKVTGAEWTVVLPALLSVVMVVATRDAWLGVMQYDSPCGPDYSWYGEGFTVGEMLIILSYLILPVSIAFLHLTQAILIFRSRKNLYSDRP